MENKFIDRDCCSPSHTSSRRLRTPSPRGRGSIKIKWSRREVSQKSRLATVQEIIRCRFWRSFKKRINFVFWVFRTCAIVKRAAISLRETSLKHIFMLSMISVGLLSACSGANLKAPCPNFGSSCNKIPINSWNYR